MLRIAVVLLIALAALVLFLLFLFLVYKFFIKLLDVASDLIDESLNGQEDE